MPVRVGSSEGLGRISATLGMFEDVLARADRVRAIERHGASKWHGLKLDGACFFVRRGEEGATGFGVEIEVAKVCAALASVGVVDLSRCSGVTLHVPVIPLGNVLEHLKGHLNDVAEEEEFCLVPLVEDGFSIVHKVVGGDGADRL